MEQNVLIHKKRFKSQNRLKTSFFRMGIRRDVTRDSVIITRDSALIRNHRLKIKVTKMQTKPRKKSGKLPFDGSN
jgi:hypothetical protein